MKTKNLCVTLFAAAALATVWRRKQRSCVAAPVSEYSFDDACGGRLSLPSSDGLKPPSRVTPLSAGTGCGDAAAGGAVGAYDGKPVGVEARSTSNWRRPGGLKAQLVAAGER